MFGRVIPDLISLASTSMMTSKHAAAVMSGRRVLSMANNYSLPAGHLVDLAAQSERSISTDTREHFECHHYPPHSRQYPVCDYISRSSRSSRLYQRNMPSYERDGYFETEYVQRHQRFAASVIITRCEKGPKAKEPNKEDGVSIVTPCGGERP